MKPRINPIAMAAGLLAGGFPASLALAQGQTPDTLDTVEVIGIAPLPGASIPVDQAPFSVKTDRLIEQDAARQSVSEGLFRGVSGVQKTDNQGNPYQSDVTYRGFSVTPLLGTPPGLSVFVDGVRQNETFGDVVRFDALPQSALKEVTVLPGTLPQFGLNSLGGAIVMKTKSGRDFQGNQVDFELGSFSRKRLGFEKGWIDDSGNRDFYINLNAFDEDGWRDRSPSRVVQAFGKAGFLNGDSLTQVSLGLYDSDLNGNGVVPRSFYEQRREQSYTYFDNTQNRGGQLAVDFTKFLESGAEFAANAYYRTSSSDTFNGDGNENEDFRFGVTEFEPDADEVNEDLGPGSYNVICDEPARTPYAPGSVSFEEDDPNALEPDSANCPGANNRGRLNQDLFGLSAQFHFAPIGINNVTVGAQAEFGRSDFRRTYALGVFAPDRTVTELHRQIEQVNVDAENRNVGVYVQDIVRLNDKTTLLLAGRFNHATVKTEDRLGDPLINEEGKQSPGLNNNYTYNRFNPSAGVSYQLAAQSTLYGSLGTSNRVPTPVELACSDPEFPCLLPNSMAADPFLEQVVTTTAELGYRSRWTGAGALFSVGVNLFRADNKDDIIFVTDGAGSGGYFANFGETRRQGLELDFGVAKGLWDFNASYQYLDATYQTQALLASEGNSSARTADDPNLVAVEGGFIQVNPGDKIPGLSDHNLKLSLGFKATPKTLVFADLQAQSDQYARGNDNNRHQAGSFQTAVEDPQPGEAAVREVQFEDNGKIPGFAVLNLGVNHQVSEGLTVMLRVNNVFDREYFNGGILGGNLFDASGQLVEDEDDIRYETFLAPGTPRSAWLGLSYRY